MKKLCAALVLVAAGLASGAAESQSPAPSWQGLQNPDVAIAYREPRNLRIYQALKTRQVLEEFNALLSPLKLRRKLTLIADDSESHCLQSYLSPNAFYRPGTSTINICYNFIDMLLTSATRVEVTDPAAVTPMTTGLLPGTTRGEVIVGGTVGLVLHELGHAIFDNLDVPRLGREEDGADEIAALIMLQFGPKVAMTTIKGTFNVWHHLQAVKLNNSKGSLTSIEHADIHGISLQRAYNFLCLAYGSPHSATFKTMADRWLPPQRKENCAAEYNAAANAFQKTIMPFVDQDKLKKVLAMEIFQPDDLK